MLRLVHEKGRKLEAIKILKRNLRNSMADQGIRNIGFPSGNVDRRIYSSGRGCLWGSFGDLADDENIPRYWNAFGIYDPDRQSQMIVVEINIALDNNTARVGGFFAEDNDTGEVFLMHTGKVGGGQPGVGKTGFLISSKAHLTEVLKEDGLGVRTGILIGKIDAPDISGRIWKFVQDVDQFKQRVRAGDLRARQFKHQKEEFDRYKKEFSGKKRGAHGGVFEYETFHGDVVQKLYKERVSRCTSDESVHNNILIDLYVKKGGVLSEVYEVKTYIDRQVLYTAIGQLATHSAQSPGDVQKTLVLPEKTKIPNDIACSLKRLKIYLRHYRISGFPEK